MIKTFEEAADLINELKICTIFASEKSGLPSLWEHVDLPDKQPGDSGWGEKITAVWTWKNQLPANYPDDIYYGKIRGGFAVLMTVDYLDTVHFKKAYKPVHTLNPLAQLIFEKIRIEPWDTTSLRKEVMETDHCSKSQFDTALKHLQISLNVVRLNDPRVERDTWTTFRDLYDEIWCKHVEEDLLNG